MRGQGSRPTPPHPTAHECASPSLLARAIIASVAASLVLSYAPVGGAELSRSESPCHSASTPCVNPAHTPHTRHNACYASMNTAGVHVRAGHRCTLRLALYTYIFRASIEVFRDRRVRVRPRPCAV